MNDTGNGDFLAEKWIGSCDFATFYVGWIKDFGVFFGGIVCSRPRRDDELIFREPSTPPVNVDMKKACDQSAVAERGIAPRLTRGMFPLLPVVMFVIVTFSLTGLPNPCLDALNVA